MGREEDVEEDDRLLEYFSEDCVFLETRANEWQSLGHGDATLLRHSNGPVFFRFWQHEQLIADDVVQRVGCPRLLFRRRRAYLGVVGPRADGPSDYLHRCGLRRRSWAAGSTTSGRLRGEGLGIPSLHLGAMVVLAKMVSTSTGSF